MADESFSIVVQMPAGDVHDVKGFTPSDSLDVLYNTIAAVTNIPKNNLKLVLKDQVVPKSSIGTLHEVGISEETSITALTSVDPRIYWRGYEVRQDWQWGNDSADEAESHERLLLDSDGSCFFVGIDRTGTEWTDGGHDVVQWDVMVGTYCHVDDVATCTWDRHVHRKISREDASGPYVRRWSDPVDSHWEEKDPRASLKWQRIHLPGSALQSEFQARIAEVAVSACPVDLMGTEWFPEAAKARIREWPATSFGEGLARSETLESGDGSGWWMSVSLMSSECRKIRADLVQRMCVAEAEEIRRSDQIQIQECESADNNWKNMTHPLRLQEHLPLDTARAVGKWRELGKGLTIDVLDKGLADFHGIDVDHCCLLGIPVLCPGGVLPGTTKTEKDGKGGTWIESVGAATAQDIISELIAALHTNGDYHEMATEEFVARGMGKYRFIQKPGINSGMFAKSYRRIINECEPEEPGLDGYGEGDDDDDD